MSLRDALLAKGLVSKDRARQVERELKEQRKHEQAHRKPKREAEAEARAAEAEAQAKAKAERAAAREAEAAARQAHEHVHRVRQIVRGNRFGARGRVPFHHRVGTTGRVACMSLPEGIARELRAGRLAIAGFQHDDGTWEHHVVSEKAAQKLVAVEPTAVVHWARGRDGLDDPANALLVRDWESSLVPHRVRDAAELDRWRS